MNSGGVFYNGVQASSGSQLIRQANDLNVFSNTFVDTEMTAPIGANQNAMGYVFARIRLTASVSGSKYLIAAPTGTTYYQAKYEFWDDLTPSIGQAFFTNQTPFVPLITTSGSTYTVVFTFSIRTGTTAGAITVRFGQLVTDAANQVILFRGAFMDIAIT